MLKRVLGRKSNRYLRARPGWDLETRRKILYLVCEVTGHQCRTTVTWVKIWVNQGRHAMSLAAAFRTDWRGEVQLEETQEEGVTVVYPRVDDCVYNGRKDGRGDWSSDGSQSSQMIEAGARQIWDVFRKGKAGAKNDSQISNTWRASKRGRFYQSTANKHHKKCHVIELNMSHMTNLWGSLIL